MFEVVKGVFFLLDCGEMVVLVGEFGFGKLVIVLLIVVMFGESVLVFGLVIYDG